MEGRIIFGPDKNLRVAGRSMVGLGASAILNKRARSNTNCSPNERRRLFSKPKKESKGA